MYHDYLMAVHLVFVVTWFAGLFYFPRLLIYDVEARKKTEIEKNILVNQFRIMQKRLLYGITWPSLVITLILGSWLILDRQLTLDIDWLKIKIILVAALVAYQISLQKFYEDLKKDKVKVSSDFLRLWNEIPTVLLFAIIFIVVLKDSLKMGYGIAGILILILVLFISIRIYKIIRKRKKP